MFFEQLLHQPAHAGPYALLLLLLVDGAVLAQQVGQFPQLAGHHGVHLAGEDEQGISLLPLVSGQEPQGDGNLRGIEQLRRHGHDAIHQIGIDDVLADVALAAAAAAGIVDPAVVGLQNLHQRAHHTGGGVEFSGQLALLLANLERQYS